MNKNVKPKGKTLLDAYRTTKTRNHESRTGNMVHEDKRHKPVKHKGKTLAGW